MSKGEILVEEMQEQDKSVREQIVSYLKKASMYGVLSDKEEQDLKNLVIENEGISKDIYRTINYSSKSYILIYLNSEGKGDDIAKERAKELANEWELKGCLEQEEKEFKSWLAGENDNMPEVMPQSKYIVFFQYLQNLELCYLSEVSTFTERVCVYGMKKGYVDIVKEPVKEMMSRIGVHYAHYFLKNTIIKYNLSNEDVMQMYSAIYSSRKTKLEAEFYLSYIQEWIENDKDEYMNAINNISSDMRRKILKKLEKEHLC